MKTINHKSGQDFKPVAEFTSYDNKRLILARSVKTLNIPKSKYLEPDMITETRYFRPGHWFILYDNNKETKDMGIVLLAHPKSKMTEKSAYYNFNKMSHEINNVSFTKTGIKN